MASDGRVVFCDGTAAARGIEALTHTLPKLELHFGDDLLVDVLTPELAVVGASRGGADRCRGAAAHRQRLLQRACAALRGALALSQRALVEPPLTSRSG